MYDYTYLRYIYEWLTGTLSPFLTNNSNILNSILTKINTILGILQNGLYLGVFAFLFWVIFVLIRPHLFKC